MNASILPQNLRCTEQVHPLGLELEDLRLSWQVQTLQRNALQSAWQIQMIESNELEFNPSALVWDSEKVLGSEQFQIKPPLDQMKAHGRYQWRVRLWDKDDLPSDWSETQHFAMGILDKSDWKKAQWIRHFQSNLRAVPCLRREFDVDGEIKDARVYATARGLFHLELNGQATSDQRLLPGWTDYSLRLPSHCWDVTALIQKGQNVLGVQLAEGWYRGPLTWNRTSKVWGENLEFLMILRIERKDGSVQWITSDENWKSAPGPILNACLFDGEQYDANIPMQGWNKAHYEASQPWYNVGLKPVGEENIERHKGVPVRAVQEFKPIDRWQPCTGRWIFNLGQNFAGHVRLKISAPQGTVLRLRFAEVLTPSREIYVDNLRTALATDTYIAKGSKDEIWEPRFTFHGFQYVELSGFLGEPADDCITGIAVGSDCPRVGELRCSNPMVEKLASNAVWTQRANYIEVPTDCPQRDERLGWTGDAQAYLKTAIHFHDVSTFFSKWLQDLEDACAKDGRAPMVAPMGNSKTGINLVGYAEAAWGDATTICPHWIARYYGNPELLEKFYGMMCRYVDVYRRTTVPNRKVRYGTESYTTPEGNFVPAPVLFGDWLCVNAETSGEIIRTAFYAYSTQLCRDAAQRLGKSSDAERFDIEWQAIRLDFQKDFLTPEGRIIGVVKATESQTAYCLALHFDLLEENQRATAFKFLCEDLEKQNFHLTTGFVGLPYLLPVLSRFGRSDLCYRLLLNKTYPSWGYEIENGATSIWERWNGYHHSDGPGDPNMNSYSHYAYGAVCEWLFTDMAGINIAGEAFSHICIRPRLGGGLSSAGASHQCIRGTIRSDWKVEGDTFKLEVEIPGNTTAEIHLPTNDPQSVSENGQSVQCALAEDQQSCVIQAGAGQYVFTCRLKA